MSDREQVIAFETEDRRVFGGTESCGADYECVQHRLKIGGGAADHPEDLAGGRLLLGRLGQAIAIGFDRPFEFGDPGPQSRYLGDQIGLRRPS